MSVTAEEIAKRYAKVEREIDKFGRVIGVRKLRPAQQMRVSEWTDTKNEGVQGAFFLAACVCEVDAAPIAFPKSREDLDMTINMLDAEGIEAASAAFVRLVKEADQPANAEEVVAAAKN